MKNNQIFYAITAILFLFFFNVGFSAASGSYIRINNWNSETKARKVNLTLSGPDDVRSMMVSNNADFSSASWEPYKTGKSWYLDYGKGTKTVYAKFKTKTGKITEIYKDTILLSIPDSMTVDFFINKNQDGEIPDQTNSRYVDLSLSWSQGVETVTLSNDKNFSDSDEFPISENISWVLSKDGGKKSIFAKFMDADKKTTVVSKSIQYNQPERYIDEGSLLKGQTNTVYYLGFDGKIHPFANSIIYHSWYDNFDKLIYLSNAKLKQYQIGQPVCVRAGTWLLKFRGLPDVYAVEPGCQLRPLLSEAEAYLLYGKNWNRRVLELDQIYSNNYQVRSYDVTDKENQIIDRDHDGVSKEEEDDNGTSDKNSDSDGDGLTDYEEIFYWFTDPLAKDSDNDRHSDLREILNGYSPLGPAKLVEVPEGTYEYPFGSIIKRKNDGKYYLRYQSGNSYYIDSKPNGNVLKSNRFPEMFIIDSPFLINFSIKSGKVPNKEEILIYPTIVKNGLVVEM